MVLDICEGKRMSQRRDETADYIQTAQSFAGGSHELQQRARYCTVLKAV